MACLRLVTFLPERPERSRPAFISRISVSTSLLADLLYLRVPFLRDVVLVRRAPLPVVVFLREALFLRGVLFLRGMLRPYPTAAGAMHEEAEAGRGTNRAARR